MNIEIELPDMGEDAGEEASVAEWYAKEGDHVDEGQVLVEMAFNGNTFDVLVPASGILLEQLVEEEDTVRVGDVLAIIECLDAESSDEEEEEEE